MKPTQNYKMLSKTLTFIFLICASGNLHAQTTAPKKSGFQTQNTTIRPSSQGPSIQKQEKPKATKQSQENTASRASLIQRLIDLSKKKWWEDPVFDFGLKPFIPQISIPLTPPESDVSDGSYIPHFPTCEEFNLFGDCNRQPIPTPDPRILYFRSIPNGPMPRFATATNTGRHQIFSAIETENPESEGNKQILGKLYNAEGEVVTETILSQPGAMDADRQGLQELFFNSPVDELPQCHDFEDPTTVFDSTNNTYVIAWTAKCTTTVYRPTNNMGIWNERSYTFTFDQLFNGCDANYENCRLNQRNIRDEEFNFTVVQSIRVRADNLKPWAEDEILKGHRLVGRIYPSYLPTDEQVINPFTIYRWNSNWNPHLAIDPQGKILLTYQSNVKGRTCFQGEFNERNMGHWEFDRFETVSTVEGQTIFGNKISDTAKTIFRDEILVDDQVDAGGVDTELACNDLYAAGHQVVGEDEARAPLKNAYNPVSVAVAHDEFRVFYVLEETSLTHLETSDIGANQKISGSAVHMRDMTLSRLFDNNGNRFADGPHRMDPTHSTLVTDIPSDVLMGVIENRDDFDGLVSIEGNHSQLDVAFDNSQNLIALVFDDLDGSYLHLLDAQTALIRQEENPENILVENVEEGYEPKLALQTRAVSPNGRATKIAVSFNYKDGETHRSGQNFVYVRNSNGNRETSFENDISDPYDLNSFFNTPGLNAGLSIPSFLGSVNRHDTFATLFAGTPAPDLGDISSLYFTKVPQCDENTYTPEADGNCGVGACATTAMTSCEEGRIIHHECTPLPATPEMCDDIDNDCDGSVDEDILGNCMPLDADGDGIPDTTDNCPMVPNQDQADANRNGIGDICEGSDRDGDGITDLLDNCPDISNADQAAHDIDGQGDACDNDDDGDGILDESDLCPIVAAPGTCDADRDGDGVANNDDNCPDISNEAQLDTDGDGDGDTCDNCILISNPDQNPQACVDTDNDGITDLTDNCARVGNADQANDDGDDFGNACDNCPNAANNGQFNVDGDIRGDACDNCIDNPNDDQRDTDIDGRGDVCDPVECNPADFVPQPCFAGVGDCRHEGMQVCDAQGHVTCPVEAGNPSPEVCDGQDNNCNGRTDEDIAPVLDENQNGLCQNNRRVCSNGNLEEAEGYYDPREEVCDGADNNCDGSVDENIAPESMNLPGICSGNNQICLNGRMQPDLRNNVESRNETCNHLDDDCDGNSDDFPEIGLECSLELGVCMAAGHFACNYESGQVECDAQPGEPQIESCNGIDDDCDGATDNVTGLNEVCTVETGLCQRNGRNVCNVANQQLACNVQPGMPVQEVCNNGLDEDCNGLPDDGCPGIPAVVFTSDNPLIPQNYEQNMIHWATADATSVNITLQAGQAQWFNAGGVPQNFPYNAQIPMGSLRIRVNGPQSLRFQLIATGPGGNSDPLTLDIQINDIPSVTPVVVKPIEGETYAPTRLFVSWQAAENNLDADMGIALDRNGIGAYAICYNVYKTNENGDVLTPANKANDLVNINGHTNCIDPTRQLVPAEQGLPADWQIISPIPSADCQQNGDNPGFPCFLQNGRKYYYTVLELDPLLNNPDNPDTGAYLRYEIQIIAHDDHADIIGIKNSSIREVLTDDSTGGWWKMNDMNNGNLLADSSRNANNATINGGANCPPNCSQGVSSNPNDRSFILDGVDDYAFIDSPDFLTDNEGTMSAWIKTNAEDPLGTGYYIMGGFYIDEAGGNPPDWNILFLRDQANNVGIYNYNPSAPPPSRVIGVTQGLNLNDGEWHFITYTQSTGANGEQRVYVDGNLVDLNYCDPPGCGTPNDNWWFNSAFHGNPLNKFLIGIRKNVVYEGGFSGNIDEAQVHNRPLSDPEIVNEFCTLKALSVDALPNLCLP